MNFEIICFNFEKEFDHIPFYDIVNLIHVAFEDRTRNGLYFSVRDISIEKYKQLASHGHIVIIKDNNTIIGTGLINIYMKSKNIYAYSQLQAVHPKYQGLGIAKLINNIRKDIAIENKCEYILTDTAVNAKSSVQSKLKSGFKIYRLESWPNTNYYSYIFRLQLNRNSIFMYDITYKISYALSYICIKVIKDKNGRLTIIGKMCSKILEIVRHIFK